MVVLQTRRLIIRPFSAGDSADLYEYLSDENVVRFEPYGVYTEAEAAKEAARRAGDGNFYAVCLQNTGRLIGNLYFAALEPPEFGAWELGYVFNAAYHGKGYAAESCREILRYAFERQGVRRVVACCDPCNAPSWRLLERLGMHREGHLLQTGFFKRDAHGEPLWHDTYAYALLAAEWRARDGVQAAEK